MIQKCVAFLRKRDDAAHGDIQYLRTEFNQTLVALGEAAARQAKICTLDWINSTSRATKRRQYGGIDGAT